jgi:hypothetical protein
VTVSASIIPFSKGGKIFRFGDVFLPCSVSKLHRLFQVLNPEQFGVLTFSNIPVEYVLLSSFPKHKRHVSFLSLSYLVYRSPASAKRCLLSHSITAINIFFSTSLLFHILIKHQQSLLGQPRRLLPFSNIITSFFS